MASIGQKHKGVYSSGLDLIYKYKREPKTVLFLKRQKCIFLSCERNSELNSPGLGGKPPTGRPPLSCLAAPLSLGGCLIFQNGCFGSSQEHIVGKEKKMWKKVLIFSFKKLPRSCCIALPLISHLSEIWHRNTWSCKEILGDVLFVLHSHTAS